MRKRATAKKSQQPPFPGKGSSPAVIKEWIRQCQEVATPRQRAAYEAAGEDMRKVLERIGWDPVTQTSRKRERAVGGGSEKGLEIEVLEVRFVGVGAEMRRRPEVGRLMGVVARKLEHIFLPRALAEFACEDFLRQGVEWLGAGDVDVMALRRAAEVG